jgi:pimeloyl-ACP methyl ester carboxylesterase
MPSLHLSSSPLAGGRPTTISYLRAGEGPVVLFLHGGWGYGVYPIDIDALASTHTVVIPSRSGYGGSTPLDSFPPHFHYCAVLETVALLDALGIEEAVWWGHSDGAVIAAMAAIHAPTRVRAVILEALHLYAAKPGSRSFFGRMASAPETFNASLRATLAADHGEDRWHHLLQLDGQAWLDLARPAADPWADLYAGRLDEVRMPALVIHGAQDPRTEANELESVLKAIPQAKLSWHVGGGHSPHSESSRETVNGAVLEFLESLPPAPA